MTIGSPLSQPPPALDFDLRLWPNPFNPKVTVSFRLSQRASAQVSVFDIAGRRVATLAEDSFSAGNHQLTWNGRDNTGQTVAGGQYLMRLEAGGQSMTRKAILLK